MKVWGKDINICSECRMYSSDEYDSGCNQLFKNFNIKFNPYQGIDKECPFSKPITKEVIEGFGFKFIINKFILSTYTKDNYKIYLGNNFNGDITEIIDTSTDKRLFKGVINNPVEMEFLLKSIGVIQ